MENIKRIYEEELTEYILRKVEDYTENENLNFQERVQISFNLLKSILKEIKPEGFFTEEYFNLSELNKKTFLFFQDYRNLEI